MVPADADAFLSEVFTFASLATPGPGRGAGRACWRIVRMRRGGAVTVRSRRATDAGAVSKEGNQSSIRCASVNCVAVAGR